jgi:hypothetical protein
VHKVRRVRSRTLNRPVNCLGLMEAFARFSRDSDGSNAIEEHRHKPAIGNNRVRRPAPRTRANTAMSISTNGNPKENKGKRTLAECPLNSPFSHARPLIPGFPPSDPAACPYPYQDGAEDEVNQRSAQVAGHF